MNTKTKIVNLEIAKEQVKAWKEEGEKVVFTNGCFDILHLGHVDYLEKARNLGTKMILGLNTDASIQRLKGEERPIVPEHARARVMASLEFIDLVVLFSEDTPLNLIQNMQPSVLVKGSDYSVSQIVGAKEVLESGGSVETIDLVEGFSTTNIIDRIKSFI
ncbi:MAG: D-glycero-beta-D-manno-heptose 1-phosphate adenylyltransferase [Cytophagales bacterium]|nr:D-glycero-beta-D-manno-heptose 1-phosphate adenylyltransferase [Cytophagales bacterium]